MTADPGNKWLNQNNKKVWFEFLNVYSMIATAILKSSISFSVIISIIIHSLSNLIVNSGLFMKLLLVPKQII